jgi:hypothetical protein
MSGAVLRVKNGVCSLAVVGLIATTSLCRYSEAQQASPSPSHRSSSEIEEFVGVRIFPESPHLSEVRGYVEKRIPVLPEFKSKDAWLTYANQLRSDLLTKVIFRGEQAARWRSAATKVEWLETIPGGPGYRIRKVRYEALPGMWIPAVLYMPDNVKGKIPVHLAVNGHEAVGLAVPYKQIRCINLAKRGIASLSPEWFGMGQLNAIGFYHNRAFDLDLVGESSLAPFYLSISKGLDILLSLPEADSSRVLMSGLSGGGWQTILLSALDTRVTFANPVAGYAGLLERNRNPTDLGDAEQLPADFGTLAGYRHLTALMAGRELLLTYNAHDNCCFKSGEVLKPLVRSVRPIFNLFNGGKGLLLHENSVPGTHNFEVDNRQSLYAAVGKVFFPNDTTYSATEIPSASELKSLSELSVQLPVNNLNFQTIAASIAKVSPAVSAPKSRDTLKGLLNYHPMTLDALKTGERRFAGGTITYWQLKVDKTWSVPLNEMTPPSPKGTTILIGDKGRRALLQEAESLLHSGQRVLAVDLLGFGGATIGNSTYPYFYLLSMIGERPLGIQVGQLVAIANWSRAQFGHAPHLQTVDTRTGIIGLASKAISPRAFGDLTRTGTLRTLAEMVLWKFSSDDYPELFCFGLLKHFDVPQLQELAKTPE